MLNKHSRYEKFLIFVACNGLSIIHYKTQTTLQMKSIKLSMKALLIGFLALTWLSGTAAENPKSEFRGAWLHIIGQGQYKKMSVAETRTYLIKQLDDLKAAGCNAIIWQIRPEADAGYPSDLEPWTRWMTKGDGWDPLAFMIEESHKRGLELHAWINPYRVTSGKDVKPAKGHIYYEHPEWFLDYADGKKYFDPGLPESRDFIDKVVRDILTRYDVDAIHMDDYFYPYPVEGAKFPDDKSFAKYGNGMKRGDWRRHNVDLLIEKIHLTIAELKPWVRFGISPFGIWRNKKNDPDGSETNGLQNYDALYADCIKWTREGWVDYMVPQLYWELEHKAASDLVLMKWWDKHAYDRHMYYGQSVRNVMSHRDIAADGGDPKNPTQLDHKIRLQRALPNVQGVVWWPGYDITRNNNGVKDSLQTRQQSTIALVPAYTWLDNIAPEAVTNLTLNNGTLAWKAPVTIDPMQVTVKYVIYRFKKGESVDINRADAILDVTNATSYKLKGDTSGYTYVVTALDRCNNESRPAKM